MAESLTPPYPRRMVMLLWDLPMGWTMGTIARDAEKARRAQLQREADERAVELLEAGLTPPEGLEDRVRFIERHGARVYLAVTELRDA